MLRPLAKDRPTPAELVDALNGMSKDEFAMHTE